MFASKKYRIDIANTQINWSNQYLKQKFSNVPSRTYVQYYVNKYIVNILYYVNTVYLYRGLAHVTTLKSTTNLEP